MFFFDAFLHPDVPTLDNTTTQNSETGEKLAA